MIANQSVHAHVKENMTCMMENESDATDAHVKGTDAHVKETDAHVKEIGTVHHHHQMSTAQFYCQNRCCLSWQAIGSVCIFIIYEMG